MKFSYSFGYHYLKCNTDFDICVILKKCTANYHIKFEIDHHRIPKKNSKKNVYTR